MTKIERPEDKAAATAKPAGRGNDGTHGAGDRNVGGREGATPPPAPELPLDDDGNDARNIGG